MRTKIYTDDDILVADIKIMPEAMVGHAARGVWTELAKEIRRAIGVDADRRASESAERTHKERSSDEASD